MDLTKDTITAARMAWNDLNLLFDTFSDENPFYESDEEFFVFYKLLALELFLED